MGQCAQMRDAGIVERRVAHVEVLKLMQCTTRGEAGAGDPRAG